MRRSSAVILVSASTATLGAGWLVGAGFVSPSGEAPTAAPTGTPGPSADPTGPTTTAPTEEPGPVAVDGAIVETEYGTVQVRVVVDAGVIVDVVPVKLTDSSETSVEVSARAAPILREEILAAQSSAVENVSGATYTSEAYLTSVQSALDAIGFTG